MSIIINVGRQLGSGGRVIAQRLAEHFGAAFYDKEILALAARESGFAPEVFERNDEHKGFLRTLFNLHAPNMSGSFYPSDFSQEGLFKLQSDAIRKAATEGSCVFVGRCADYVLRDFPNVVNIFVTASLDFRMEHVRLRNQCTDEEARRIIEKGEAERAAFYNYYTGKRWGAAENYHLCVDASLLGVEPTADYIARFIESMQLQHSHE